jgi:pyruvate/2-oxoglutarate dehydrogenase complex dihydrolipoamide dehydrogenase (E3) component
VNWTHDVVVIGAGSAGLTAAGGCARLGLRVALMERDRMGGECLNTGCVPSKALLAASRRAHLMRGERLGISGSGPVVDFAAVRAHLTAAITAIAPHDSVERFEAWGVEVIRGEAILAGRNAVQVGTRTLRAPRIVLSTGSDPGVPDIPGLQSASFFTNETLFGMESLPSHLVVLGGGSIGVEMAQAFRRLGSAVTIVESGDFLSHSDRDAATALLALFRVEGITVLEHTAVTLATGEPGRIRLECKGGVAVDGSHLLVATGRRSRVDGIGLERAGVAWTEDGITVDAQRRTSNKAIYAIGDCRTGPRFTHAAGYEGRLVVASLAFGLSSQARFDALPTVTYTDPELAQLGLTEAEARTRHRQVEVTLEPWSENDRAITEGETNGFIKLVKARGRVVGVTILGANAGELLLPWSMVMRRRASRWALSKAIVPYPTRSELSQATAFRDYEPMVFGPAARRWARTLAWKRRF